jgi:hypothetical protein
MLTSSLSYRSWRWTNGLIILAILSGTAPQALSAATDDRVNLVADNPAPVNHAPVSPSAGAASPVAVSSVPEAPSHHSFWDHENLALFATVGALSAADFAVTRTILQNGGKELNPVTRLFSGSTAGLAANFAGETAAIIGLSYCFHKTGHHRLERLVPMVNIGSSAVAVAYDLSHR